MQTNVAKLWKILEIKSSDLDCSSSFCFWRQICLTESLLLLFYYFSSPYFLGEDVILICASEHMMTYTY